MTVRIQKRDGEYQEFSLDKLERSMRRAGATDELIHQIIRKVQDRKNIQNTREIYDMVYKELVRARPPAAARYSLKKALHSLGPTGYPFEQYIAAIYSFMGYETVTNQILQGSCITHEMDVIARSGVHLLYIECKYHQSQSSKCNVKIPLYVNSRALDLLEHQSTIEHADMQLHFMIATNTKFTTDAVQYANCKGLRLLSWQQPTDEPLPKIIDTYGLHPVTTMTTLNKPEALKLISAGIVMVRDIPNNRAVLHSVGIKDTQITAIVAESEEILKIGYVG